MGDRRRKRESSYRSVPCGLPTTHRCDTCDVAVCRWHKVANHSHVITVSEATDE